MLKTKKAAKWLESAKKNALIDILEKPFKRVFKRPTLGVPYVSLSSEALREEERQRLEMEREKAKALAYAHRIQTR